VIRYNDLGERIVSAQDDMTSLLALPIEACPLQGLDTLAARNPW
jgi:hypothetical protein